jgi:NTE family protein
MRAFMLAGVLAALLGCSVAGRTAAASPAAVPVIPPASEAPPAQGVALVLSGGGARGVAHLGVLKVLEEMRVPVDCVVGTSMGAIVGGAYASGMALGEMERRVRAADWVEMFQNALPRDRQPFREKQDALANRSAITLGYGGGGFLLPQSAIAGQQLDRFLTGLAGDAESLPAFDTLALPYRAIATDLETGAMVVMNDGPLWRAMRASMAVPGVFLPIEHHGRLLVDGGLVMNLPVDVGRELCGGRVIAVNLGTPPLGRERLNTATDIVLQAINLALEQNVQQQLGRIGAQDALIEVELGDISSRDFNRVLETIPLGERAARAAADALAHFAVDEDSYARWQAQRQARLLRPAPIITAVEVEGLRHVPAQGVLAGLRQRSGQTLDTRRLERDLEGLYARGDFERLRYRVERDGAFGRLLVEAVDKSWGPNYLRFGGGLAADLEGDGAVGLYAGLSRRWINDWEGRLNVDLQVGTTNRLRGELFQPLGLKSSWFVAPMVQAGSRTVPVYQDARKVADFRVREATLGLDLGYELGEWGELRAGWHRGREKGEIVSGMQAYSRQELDQGKLRLSAVIDRLDSPFFPRRGYRAQLLGEWHDARFGSDLDYRYAEFDASWAASSGPHSLHLGLVAAGSPDRELPAAGRYTLGGLFRLSGYRYGELAADQVVLASASYYRLVTTLPEALGRGVYLGATLEWASLRNYALEAPSPGNRNSMALFLGADTVLGPLYVGVAYAARVGEPRYYLLIGQPY